MGRVLAVVEAMLLFAAASAMGFLWGRRTAGQWPNVTVLLGQVTGLVGCCMIAFYSSDLYDLRRTRNLALFVPKLVQSIGLTFILLAVLYVACPSAQLTDGAFVSSFLLLGAFILPLRALCYSSTRRRPFLERVLILGANELTLRLADEINAQPHLGYEIVGIVDDGGDTGRGLNGQVIGLLEEFSKLVAETKAQRVIVALAKQRGGSFPGSEFLHRRAGRLVVEDAVEVYERLTGKVPLEWWTPSRRMFSKGLRRRRPYERTASTLSRSAAVVALVVTAPLLAIIAASIKLESHGPVLFVQKRVGLYGRPFRLLKFRTMAPDPHAHSEWVCDNTARITLVGKWLRKFHLDELPQLINIMRGDMAFIGPRPHPTSNYALFADRIPHYPLRCGVRPGVTGWAQVRFGYANNLEEEIEKMRFDLYYIKHRSLRLDMRILFDTVRLMLFGRQVEADGCETGNLAKLAEK